MVIEAKEILVKLKEKYRSYSAICRITRLNRTTLLRIARGDTSRVHPRTLGKLVQALTEK